MTPVIPSEVEGPGSDRAASLRPWLRRTWRFTGLALVTTLACAGALIAKDHQLLGGYHHASTDFIVSALFLSGPALLASALVLLVLGGLGLAKAGLYRGFGLTVLAGLALSIVGLLGSLLAIAIASAPP
jgi:hypothetical protein